MRLKLFFILAFLHISVLSLGQDRTDVELERFNKFLGLERAAALSDAVDSFDRFLLTNYPEFDNSRDRSRAFLKQIAQHNKPKESWILETERNAKIIESFESTGLRKEIWVYGYEAYESEHDFSKVLPPVVPDTSEIYELGELDIDLVEDEIVPIGKVDTAEIARRAKEREEARLNSLSTNYEGDYLYALLRYTPQDSFAYDFAAAMYNAGVEISLGVISDGLLNNELNYDDPFTKRILVTQFYFWVVNWDNRREK